MYDGKRSTAEKILYDALEKIKTKNNEDPLKTFNTAIGNVNQILSVGQGELRSNLSSTC